MKIFAKLAVALAALCVSGCMNDQTKTMAEVCQQILERDSQPAPTTFMEDAEVRLASLDKPQNRFVSFARDLQDPEAMTYKPALEQCVSQLRQRQPAASMQ